ncbi:MAG: DNA polymerase III subunit chi [Betaproteobacteria bacterium HGW-Betaproteobacteria-3]|jgi:DNA polymerase-3 subunit chi|nr:MAG: DNA polymerase III subunit chi [Betaproteobacteria bacterium HGW-Betaproteobacteria-3]
MTEIAFHFNTSDKLAYTCRLLRKAVASGARVVVTAESPTLQQLDAALWTFSALDFLPHCAAQATPEVLARSPIVLTEVPADAPHQQVLVNLSDHLPDGFERFERLIEVVSGDAADRQAARQRWKHYADRGYAIVRHDVMQKESA